jgi:putative membrane protein
VFLTILSAGLHALALGIGLGSVFARGTHFRGLKRPGSDKTEEFRSLFMADTFWGLAAFLWILTGLFRVFGGAEKEPDFYLHNPWFHIKMGLFLLVFLLEVLPMVTLLKWRVEFRKKGKVSLDRKRLDLLVRLNDIEVGIVVLIPFVAAAMARGIWLVP